MSDELIMLFSILISLFFITLVMMCWFMYRIIQFKRLEAMGNRLQYARVMTHWPREEREVMYVPMQKLEQRLGVKPDGRLN